MELGTCSVRDLKTNFLLRQLRMRTLSTLRCQYESLRSGCCRVGQRILQAIPEDLEGDIGKLIPKHSSSYSNRHHRIRDSENAVGNKKAKEREIACLQTADNVGAL